MLRSLLILSLVLACALPPRQVFAQALTQQSLDLNPSAKLPMLDSIALKKAVEEHEQELLSIEKLSLEQAKVRLDWMRTDFKTAEKTIEALRSELALAQGKLDQNQPAYLDVALYGAATVGLIYLLTKSYSSRNMQNQPQMVTKRYSFATGDYQYKVPSDEEFRRFQRHQVAQNFRLTIEEYILNHEEALAREMKIGVNTLRGQHFKVNYGNSTMPMGRLSISPELWETLGRFDFTTHGEKWNGRQLVGIATEYGLAGKTNSGFRVFDMVSPRKISGPLLGGKNSQPVSPKIHLRHFAIWAGLGFGLYMVHSAIVPQGATAKGGEPMTQPKLNQLKESLAGYELLLNLKRKTVDALERKIVGLPLR